ncbi:MAG: hypothetical protein M3R15_33880 [Acidobacteriota bacterium]|nr:hypothetical protein [Acidobacteriota bacterium]
MNRIVTLVTLLIALSVSTLAADRYVSATAPANGTGSIDKPWSIWEATNVRPPAGLLPGDTINFRGGIYKLDTSNEPDTSYWEVAGTATAPITVRNFPGERVQIDIDYQLQIHGAHTRYIGLEFTTLRTKKVYASGWSPDRPGEFAVMGNAIKVINCVFHDMMGTSAFAAAKDYEMYGNIMYYIGFIGGGTPWGTTAYVQNPSLTSRKDITDNLMFHQFRHNLQIYGSDAAIVKNVYATGNTIFNPGSLTVTPAFNSVVWVGAVAVENVDFTANYFYTPTSNGSNVVFWGAGGVTNLNLTVKDNYIVGGAPALRLGVWNPVTFTGNKIVGQSGLAWYEGALPSPRAYNWNRNMYHQGDATPFSYASKATNLAAFKSATGLDTDSTHSATRPTGTEVFVRPNKYEQGRAHVTVFNWGLANTASINLSTSGLVNGQSFEIRDAQDFFGTPIHKGVYDGKPITLNLPDKQSPVTPVLGATDPANAEYLVLPVHTGKEFNAFVVLPGAVGVTPPPPPPVTPPPSLPYATERAG